MLLCFAAGIRVSLPASDGFGPRLPGLSARPVSRSMRARKRSLPRGRPMLSAARSGANRSCSGVVSSRSLNRGKNYGDSALNFPCHTRISLRSCGIRLQIHLATAPASPYRASEILRQRLRQSNPTGKSPKVCPALRIKIFPLQRRANQKSNSARLPR